MSKQLILVALILSLCIGLWYQYQQISNLRAENTAQAQLITEQEATNKRLLKSIEQERQAVEERQKQVDELTAKITEERGNVREILIKEPCGSTALPSGVIDSIKRLHK